MNEEKVKKLQALKRLKEMYKAMIEEYNKNPATQVLVDEMLDYLSNIIKEIKSLEDEN